ncbi:MAG: hypothetical protein IKT32_02425 [Clostridia bacterium]|nr:hypothetical protein [Clostridia bacterium]
MEALVITIISELITLAGVIATCLITHSKTIYRIEQLEKKQDRYNNLQERMYECETDIKVIQTELSH